jgi:hypothetical protein
MTYTTKPGARHTSKGFERLVAVPSGEKKKGLVSVKRRVLGG